jgi:hypothetical protein
MATIRKYWFMLLLLGTLLASVIALLDSSLEKRISSVVGVVWLIAVIAHLFDRIEKIERRLDAMNSEKSEKPREGQDD